MHNRLRLTLCWVGLLIHPMALADFESPSEGLGDKYLEPALRPWDASVRFFIGHNDNVQLVPDATFFDPAGERESIYYGVSVNAVYRFVQTPEWTAGIGVAADRLLHEEGGKRTLSYDPPDWYDLTAYQPTLFVKRHFLVTESIPGSIGLTYAYRSESLKVHAGGLESHAVGVEATVQPNPNLELNAGFSQNDTDFDVPFTGPANRDGDYQAFNLGGTYSWDSGLRSLSFDFARTDNDTDGGDFDYEGNVLKARFETNLQGPFWLGLEAAMDDRDYNGGWGRTGQEITRLGVQLLWVIDQHWVADAYFDKSEYEGNAAEFDSDQTKYGIGVTYRF